MPHMFNIFTLPQNAAIPGLMPEEITDVLAEGGNVRIERIISAGHVSGWYDQTETEFVLLLDGEAEIEFENGGAAALKKGDALTIKPRERHRVSYTSSAPPCVWLCVFF
jgi:cupin 2 domain-containing protein